MVDMDTRPRAASLRRTMLRATAVSVAFAVTLSLTGIRTDGAPVREYELKAAFLLNFVRFVDWPAATPKPRVGRWNHHGVQTGVGAVDVAPSTRLDV